MRHATTTQNSAARRGRARMVGLLCAATGVLVFSGCMTRTVYVKESPAPAPDPAPQMSASAFGAPPPAYDVAAVDEFYEPLSTYGRWYAHGQYGNVWIPSTQYAGANFRPYTQGHWEYTEWGNTWVSGHPFGWATGHYGRWFYDGQLGWVWVPGTRWAPAWVTWRTGGGYIGWAALPPGARIGASYNVYDTSWVFVQTGYFGYSNVSVYIVRDRGRYNDCVRTTRWDRNTVNVRGDTYYRGPRYEETGPSIRTRPIRETDRDTATSRPPRGTVVAGNDRDGGDHNGSRNGRPERDGRDTTPVTGRDGRGGDHNGSTRNGRDDVNTGRTDTRTGRDDTRTGRDDTRTGRTPTDTRTDRDDARSGRDAVNIGNGRDGGLTATDRDGRVVGSTPPTRSPRGDGDTGNSRDSGGPGSVIVHDDDDRGRQPASGRVIVHDDEPDGRGRVDTGNGRDARVPSRGGRDVDNRRDVDNQRDDRGTRPNAPGQAYNPEVIPDRVENRKPVDYNTPPSVNGVGGNNVNVSPYGATAPRTAAPTSPGAATRAPTRYPTTTRPGSAPAATRGAPRTGAPPAANRAPQRATAPTTSRKAPSRATRSNAGRAAPQRAAPQGAAPQRAAPQRAAPSKKSAPKSKDRSRKR